MKPEETRNILLVEDEALIALSTKKKLESRGYSVIHVFNGEDAISQIKEENLPFSLILMDIDLGNGIDGTEAAQIILNRMDIPVVFLSSHIEPEIVNRTEQISSYGYVVKNSGDVVLDASIKMAFRLFQEKQKVTKQQQQLIEVIADLKSTNEKLQESLEQIELSQKRINESKEELIEKEAFLDRIINQSPFATWITDATGTMVKANDALKDFLNLTDEQLIGKYNILKDKNVMERGLMPLVETVFTEGKTVSFTLDWEGYEDTSLDLKGSKKVFINATIFPVFNKHNKLINAVCNWIDITKQKMTDIALEKSKTMLRYILDIIPQAVFWKDDKGVYLGCNKAFADVAGVTSTEGIIGKTDFELPWTEEDANAYREDDNLVITTNKPKWHIIEEVQRNDGVRILIDTTKLPLRNEDGSAYGVLGVFEDVTREKQIK